MKSMKFLLILSAAVLLSSQTTHAFSQFKPVTNGPSAPHMMTATIDGEHSIPAAKYTSDPSDHRYAAGDWWHIVRKLPQSSILKEIRSPVSAITIWAFAVSVVHKMLKLKNHSIAQTMCISSKPHSMLVSALGLLLVFRTNSAYQRFTEGRKIWERILSVTRNMSRLATLYETDLGLERKQRVFRLLAAFPYLLRHHIQPQCLGGAECAKVHNSGNGLLLDDQIEGSARDDQRMMLWQRTATSQHCWVDRRSLPWCLFPNKALQRCADSPNRPLWVCDRLSQELTNVAYNPNFTSRERLTFLGHVDKLSQCIGECERIHQTAVPLNYARHSLRSLSLWLITLPFAVVSDLGLLTGPTMAIISWLMFGVYQIGYSIEDPFQGSLQLSVLCDSIYRDVMYGLTPQEDSRESAFQIRDELDEWKSMTHPSMMPTSPVELNMEEATMKDCEEVLMP